MAVSSSTAIEQVVSLFDRAPLEPARWHDALRGLASLTGSGRAELLGLEKTTGTKSFDWISDDEAALQDGALAIGAYRKSVNFRIAASQGVADMMVVDERHYDAARSSLTDDRYVEFSERNDIPFGCQTSLLNDSDRLVGLAILRTREDGRTTAEQRRLFAAVAPRVRSAMELQIAIEHQGQHLLLGAFDAVSTKALLVDSTGRIRDMTPAADRMLRSMRRIWVKDGRIETPVPLEARRIAQAIHQAIEHRKGAAVLVLPPLTEDQHGLRLTVHATPRQAWNIGIAPSAMIVLKDAALPIRMRRDLVMEHYGLTFAEAEIVIALTEGKPRDHIAALRNVSISTIRTQIKTIYQKLGVVREAELVALALQLFQGS